MSSANLIMAAGGQEEMFTYSTFTTVYSGSGTISPPVGAKAMRVAAIGAGGSPGPSAYTVGGGGGGCAASKIVPASLINYSVGLGGNNTAPNGGDTTAQFTGYTLIGGGGKTGPADYQIAPGGVGIGGDYNFSGGYGGSVDSRPKAGGAAGPNGNGGNYGQNGGYSGTGWGPGGGAGAALTDQSTANTSRSSGAGGPGSGSIHMFGLFSSGPFITPIDASTGGNKGGIPGGGGGFNGAGGSGCVLVEWFF